MVQSPVSMTTWGDNGYASSMFNRDLDMEKERLGQLDLSDRAASSPLPSTAEPVDGRPAPVLIQPLGEFESNATPGPAKSSNSLPMAAGKAISSAYGEVRHFAGGLISHPAESTKHYSILRHSHGLVYYSGSYTNLAITLFADRELPSDRTFWLQRKGWSGETGMKAGAFFGTHGSWIDVTPSITATADQMKPADERAFQRDIKKFLRKAPKKLAQHQLRETNVLRIPCEADDGYLRVVMCAGEKGKKTLCPSPVFRLASTSMSSSSIRGSSLKTLPVEAAIKIGTVAAQKTATTFAGPYVETARMFMTNQITSVYQPSAIVQTAATTAYGVSGVPDKIDVTNEQYEDARESSQRVMEQEAYDALTQPVVIGDEAGPRQPYPIRFYGKIVAGTGQSMAALGIPTANLANVDSDILLKHTGIHFGWASLDVPKKLRDELLIDDDWREAVISIIPDPSSRANVVQKKIVRVYILEEFEGAKFFDAKLSVILMGFIRPASQVVPGEQPDPQATLGNLYTDITSTSASLARSAWQADETLERIRSTASSRSITERYVDARQSTQKRIDKVPVWSLGVRSDGAALKDRFIRTGGITIRR